MKLLLSADALVGEAPDAIAQACHRRAFAGFEGTTVDLDTADALATQSLAVPWLLHTGGPLPELRSRPALRTSGLLLASLPYEPLPSGRVAFVHDSDADAAAQATVWAHAVPGAGTAWEVEPRTLTEATLHRVLALTGPTLVHVRLLKNRPDEADGGLLAVLLVQLALLGFAGTMALAPAPHADLGAWSDWLQTRRGWGCGTAHDRATASCCAG